MKKLLIVHHWGGIGGAGLSLLHIINAIDKDRYQIYVVCPKHPNEMIKALEKENCKIIPVEKALTNFNHYNGGIKHAFSPRTISNLVNIVKDKKKINQIINSISPDIVAVNSMTLFWVGKIAKIKGLKTICFHRETYQKGLVGFRTSLIKYGLSRWFDKVAFISNYDLQKTGKLKGESHVIYDCVDTRLFNNYSTKEAREKLGLNQQDIYILFLGGLSSLKGAEVIIDAMKYIKNEKVKLVFISEITSFDELNKTKLKTSKDLMKSMMGLNTRLTIWKLIIKNKLKEKIIFKKRNNYPELFYSACDLVVFPSTLAHQSRPIYEAGIAKIPIIITDFPETNEFAKNGYTAITFENKNSKELAEKIEIILDKKINVKKIVKNNYLQSEKNHNFSSLSNEIEKLLNFDVID